MNYWKYFEKALDVLREKTNYTPTDTQRQTFDELVRTLDSSHNGVYLIQIDLDSEKHPGIFKSYMNLLTFKFPVKDDHFIPQYRGKTLVDVTPESLTHHSHEADGAIVVDKKLRVIDDHRVVKRIRKHLIAESAQTGTGHASLATLSLWPLVTTYAASNERKTVTTFSHGGPIDELCYDPKAPVPYNATTFTDDMLRYINVAESQHVNHAEKTVALMNASRLLHGVDDVWDQITEEEKGKAIFYLNCNIQPLAKNLGVDITINGRKSQ